MSQKRKHRLRRALTAFQSPIPSNDGTPACLPQSACSCHHPHSAKWKETRKFPLGSKRGGALQHAPGENVDDCKVAPPSVPSSALGLPGFSARNHILSFPWLLICQCPWNHLIQRPCPACPCPAPTPRCTALTFFFF